MSYNDLYVVGIGASAGGFEALQKFLPRLPKNKNIAYIIAQHLDPKRPTLFGELLSKSSSFKVIPINDGEKIKANHIYFCPPNKDVTVTDGTFHLTVPSSKQFPKPSINKFFTSLAQEKKEKAMGIILSGTGSDGAIGISEIALHGGITLTEDEGAKYYSMPKAAIDTGKVIASLPPELLAEGIEYVLEDRHYFDKHFAIQDSIEKIFDILNTKTNIDFSSYKDATITRRIKKRMSEMRAQGVDDYLDMLLKNDAEVDKLKDELLIIVTSFFRDKEAFLELNTHLETLLTKKLDNVLRIWVTACATGEEAYTMAMLVHDLMEKNNISKKVTIFATDVSEKVIRESRGRYFTHDQLEGVSESYIEKYFDFENGVYKPNKTIRDMIVFSKHDIIKDPPFLNIDLLSCRNLLIYFNNELQKRILSIFYYALKFESILFLGKSETVGTLTSLFSVLDAKYKIYKKSNDLAQIDLDVLTYVKKSNYSYAVRKDQESMKVIDVDFSINKAVSNIYGGHGIVVDQSNNILFYKGDSKDFINHPTGIHTNDIFRVVVEYLRLDLRATLNESRKHRRFVSSKKIRVTPVSEPKEYVVINVFPLEKNKLGDQTYFVSFDKSVDTQTSINAERFDPVEYNDSQMGALEDELLTLKERLQITIEELETSNEELQSTNEELQSTNEELQSTNEELETSNEELQSTNEELQTVNDELTYSNIELEYSNKAFNSVLGNLNTYVMILDTNLNIIKFTDGINQFFDMSKTVDTNFTSVLMSSNVELPNILDDIKRCLHEHADIGYNIDFGNKNYYFTIKNVDMSINKNDKNRAIVLSFIDRTEYIRQENIIFQQSKMATMGEMIGNIAHQWRQPINSLSLQKEIMVDQFENNELDQGKIEVYDRNTSEILKYMSQTIDDFRNFFVPNKKKKTFNLVTSLRSIDGLMQASLDTNNIHLSSSFNDEEILLYGYENELKQVFINLINNSKDAIIQNNIQNGTIEINVTKNNGTNQVEISFFDNAGGIDQSIADKVFDPYFTTKFKAQGTGLGLFMSKNIVEKNMGGILSFRNFKDGAEFKIILDLAIQE